MQAVYKLIATSLGVGFLPLAPGTWGAAIGIIVLFLLQYFALLSTPLLIGLIIVFFLLGIYVTDQLEAEWGKDPSKVVIDETIGVWINVLFLPFNWTIWLIGFVLFRILDIWKPLGIRKLEKIGGGLGVMIDDVAAGVAGNIILQIIYYFYLIKIF